MRKVRQNFGLRIKACLNRQEAHIEGVNFKQYAKSAYIYLFIYLGGQNLMGS